MLRADRGVTQKVEQEVTTVTTVYEAEPMGENLPAPQKKRPEVGVYRLLVSGSDTSDLARKIEEQMGIKVNDAPKVRMLVPMAGHIVEKVKDGEPKMHQEIVGQIQASVNLWMVWDAVKNNMLKFPYDSFKGKSKWTEEQLHAQFRKLAKELYEYTDEDVDAVLNHVDDKGKPTFKVSYRREVGILLPAQEEGEDSEAFILSLSFESARRYEWAYVPQLVRTKKMAPDQVLTKITANVVMEGGQSYTVADFEALDINTGQPLGISTKGWKPKVRN